jgi:hypothetical protein
MPISTTRQVPREVKGLPPGAKKIWSAAFKQAMKEKPEHLAEDLAMQAVKKLFKKVENEEGEEEWVTGEEAEKRKNEEIVAAGGDPEAEEGEEGEEIEGEETEGKPKKRAAAEGEEPEEEEEDPKKKKKPRVIKVSTSLSETAADSIKDVQLTELLMLDAKGFTLTQDGFLVTEPRVARTGIQIYKGFEVGAPHMDNVRVYRPESEVFDKRAMSSLAHRTVTLEHPDTTVNASNWKELAVGHSVDPVARDGDFIRVPLILMDAGAIMAAQSGKSQLSVGYGAKLVWGDGVTPSGERYDAMQTEIRANHIALVSTARGGDKLRIGDRGSKGNRGGQQRSKPMTERTLTIDGVSITLEDKDGQILDRYLVGLTRRIKDQEEEIEELEKKISTVESDLTTAKKDSSTKDGEIAVLKQTVEDSKQTPEKIHKAIEATMEVVDRATSFFGDSKYVWRGKSDAQMKREVVAARLGDAKAKTMDDAMIEGAFLSITEPEVQDGFTRMTQSFSRPPVNGNINDAAAKAYDKRNEELANRWKKNKKPFGATA